MRGHPMRALLSLASVLLLLSCQPDSHPSRTVPKSVEFVEQGMIRVDGNEVLVGTNRNTDNDLLVVAGENGGEGIGVLAHRDTVTGAATIYGVVFSDSSGNSMTATLNSQGFPDTVAFNDGSYMVFTNYTATGATVSAYDTSGAPTVSRAVVLGDAYEELRQIVSENGLSIGDSTDLAKRLGSYVVTGKISGWSLTLKIASNVLSIAGCAGSTLVGVTGVGAALTVAACISAAQGVISTIAYVAGNDSLSNMFGLSSTIWGAFGCVGADIGSCVSTALSTIDNLISRCTPDSLRAIKACRNGWVYWFDDCGKPYEPVEQCPCGCEKAACVPIELCGSKLNITTAISADPVCAEAGEYIFFTASVSGGDASSYVYTWKFGDGGSSVLKEESHAYAKDGAYTVTLTVEDDSSNYGFTSTVVEIGNCSKVSEVIIESNTSCAEVNESVSFSSLVTGGDKWSYQYHWNFGDGGASSEANVSHTYTAAGTYVVSLTVAGADGGKAAAMMTQKVGGCTHTLEVDITGGADCVDTGMAVSFAADVQGGDQSSLTYAWNFGDGSTSSSAAPSHTFTQIKTHTVSLHVTDAFDSVATDEMTVKVGNCADTASGAFDGKVAYTYIDLGSPQVSGVKVKDVGAGSEWQVSMPSGVSYLGRGLTSAGVVIISGINSSTFDDRLLASGNWGRTTPSPIGTSCGDSVVNWSSDDAVGVSASGIVYFHGSYDSTYYDSIFERNSTAVIHRLMAIPASQSGCSFVRADFNGDGDYTDEAWDDTDLEASDDGSVIVLSRPNVTGDALYAVRTATGAATKITDRYDGQAGVSADGSRCIFEIEGSDVIPHLASASTSGGTVVDLNSQTGLMIISTGAFLSPDGTECVAWVIDQVQQRFRLALIRTDGSSVSYLNAPNISLASTLPGQFTPDGNGIVFVADTASDPQQAVGDIYYIGTDGKGLTNLTNTPSTHEDAPLVR